jgi:hypothetical protein
MVFPATGRPTIAAASMGLMVTNGSTTPITLSSFLDFDYQRQKTSIIAAAAAVALI